MKKILITVSFVLHMLLNSLAQSWQSIELASINTNSALLDAQFWGDTGIIVSKNGKIFQSNNFFSSFTEESSYENSGFAAISFVSRDNGYITSCLVQGGMLKTNDGGNTWAPLPFGPQIGVCVGENFITVSLDTLLSARRENSNCLWSSYDAGQNWHCNVLPYNEVLKIILLNDTTLYGLLVNRPSLGMPGILNIFYTTNYGVNWQNTFTSNLPSTRVSSDFYFINDSTLILVVDGAILRSENKGFSFDTTMHGQWWSDIVNYNNKSISFSSPDTGFVSFTDKVYKTVDAGNTWIKTDFVFDSVDLQFGNEINFIKAFSSSRVILGCKLGNIYITETGGGIWSGVEEVEVRKLTLHPNPATTHLTIAGTEPNTTATITNLHGQVVLQSAIRNPQSDISVEALPPGLYFCILQSGQERKVLRFVKQ